MKVLVCVKPGHFEYQTREKPALKKDHAIIKIARIGVCGTDLHAFEGTQPFFTYPRILGHELSGELIAFDNAPGFIEGEQVTIIPYFSCGKCIACRNGKPNCCATIKVFGVHTDGGMCEYISVPSNSLVHGSLIPDELALTEPLSIGAHGIRRAQIKKGEYVLVAGAGPIGLGVMEFARLAGGNVIAMDVNKHRLSLCKKNFGINHIIHALDQDINKELMRMTLGNMPEVIIDATGNLQAINGMFQYMAHGGRYILIGLQKNNISFSHPEFHKREATLMSSRNATREDFDHVMDSMKHKRINLKSYITHRVKFSEVKAQFSRWLEPENHVVKVMVEMD